MKLKRSHVVVAIMLLVVGVVWVRGFWFREVFRTRKSNEPNRTALLQIRDAVSIGASHADVLTAYWQHRTDELRLSAERPVGWSVRMPLEFGASDWMLLIEFTDGRVSAVRIRTSDGPPPEDGPKDKKKDAS
jgi:hypothetical protein